MYEGVVGEREVARSDPSPQSPREEDAKTVDDDRGEKRLHSPLARSDEVSSMARVSKKNKRDILVSLKKLDNMDFKKFIQEQKKQRGKESPKREFLSDENLRPRGNDACEGEENEANDEEVGGRRVRIDKSMTISGDGTKSGSLRKVKSDGIAVGQKGQSLKLLQHHSMTEFVELKVIERKRRSNTYKALAQLLLDNEVLAMAICLSIARGESDSAYAKIIRFFLHHKKDMQLIRLLMQKEIKETVESATLFRSNEVITKLLSAHARVIGRLFLVDVLRQPIEQILLNMDEGNGYEIDPIKLGPDCDEKIKLHTKNIEKAVEMVLDGVDSNLPLLPRPINHICVELEHMVSEKFNQDTFPVVGGYFFLRFICPAMFAPENYGIVYTSASAASPYLYSVNHGRIRKSVVGEISKDMRRALILVSKALQQLANGIPFGAKEEYMTVLNPFLDKNFERMRDLFKKILAPEETREERGNEFKFDDQDMESTLHVFHRILHDTMDDVEQNFNHISRFMTCSTPRRILADAQMKERQEWEREKEREKDREKDREKGEGGEGDSLTPSSSSSSLLSLSSSCSSLTTSPRDEEEEGESSSSSSSSSNKGEKEEEKESALEKALRLKEEEVIKAAMAIPKIELMTLSGRVHTIQQDNAGPLSALRDLVKFLGEPPSKTVSAEMEAEKAKVDNLRARNEAMQKLFEQRYRSNTQAPTGNTTEEGSPNRRPLNRRLKRSNSDAVNKVAAGSRIASPRDSKKKSLSETVSKAKISSYKEDEDNNNNSNNENKKKKKPHSRENSNPSASLSRAEGLKALFTK